jgi:hypothetical protein
MWDLVKGSNEEGTPMLKVQWELKKYADSWVLNTPACRPAAPYKEWLKAKKAAATVAGPPILALRANATVPVWEEEQTKKLFSEILTLHERLAPYPVLMDINAEHALRDIHAACVAAISPLAFKPKTFRATSTKFKIAQLSVAALLRGRGLGIPEPKKETHKKGACLTWELASYPDAFNFFYDLPLEGECHTLLKAAWSAGQAKTEVHTHAEINERMPLR